MGKSADRPFSQACENNKQAILDILRECLVTGSRVLEIGSGTGQHARHFAENLPGVRWQPTDLAENLAGIESWREGYSGDNLLPPLELDVRNPQLDLSATDVVFTANSLHIMSWRCVQLLFGYLGSQAPHPGQLLVYGPFNYDGGYTSESNAQFDRWLGLQHHERAIRDFEDVDALAAAAGFTLAADHAMPANNRLLHWCRSG